MDIMMHVGEDGVFFVGCDVVLSHCWGGSTFKFSAKVSQFFSNGLMRETEREREM